MDLIKLRRLHRHCRGKLEGIGAITLERLLVSWLIAVILYQYLSHGIYGSFVDNETVLYAIVRPFSILSTDNGRSSDGN
jgi:hypothetical protein